MELCLTEKIGGELHIDYQKALEPSDVRLNLDVAFD